MNQSEQADQDALQAEVDALERLQAETTVNKMGQVAELDA